MARSDTPLAEKLKNRIRQHGPITVADYMQACLGDPEYGYYLTRLPFGKTGDFTTAPEISQIFGELIGLWSVVVWQSMGQPEPIKLIELGPGRGTLMGDALRAVSKYEPFCSAVEIHLVETSPLLAKMQKKLLGVLNCPAEWHANLEDVEEGPAIIIANEFFDALPIRQFVWDLTKWHERAIGLNEDGHFQFEKLPVKMDDLPEWRKSQRDVSSGSIVEHSPASDDIIRIMAERSRAAVTAALIIDYGPAGTGFGDSLQAVRDHQYADPLDKPGQADLTAHVDFSALKHVARSSGLAVYGPIPQSQFLLSLGLAQRTNALIKNAKGDEAKLIASSSERLIDPSLMGDLFKAMVVSSDQLSPPAPFDQIA